MNWIEEVKRLISLAKTAGWFIDGQQLDTGHYRTVRLNQINGILDETLAAIPDEAEMPISQAMEELSRLVGRYFEDIDDVEKYVTELRGGKGEDE